MATFVPPTDWRHGGVRVVRAGDLSENTAQTPGMNRRAAVTPALGARSLWGGTVDIQAGAATGAHHHGTVESIIYVLSGYARMRWGDALEFIAEAGPGDFIYVPPFVPHQEINAGDAELKCVIVRSQPATPGDAVIVNLPEIRPVEIKSAEWVDAVHPAGHVYGIEDATRSLTPGTRTDVGHDHHHVLHSHNSEHEVHDHHTAHNSDAHHENASA